MYNSFLVVNGQHEMKYIIFVVELINRKEKHFLNWKLKKITREFICDTFRQF